MKPEPKPVQRTEKTMTTTNNAAEIVAAELAGVLTDLVKCAVTKPEAVKVISSVHGPLIAMLIKTEQYDVKRVIGTKGKHFRALEVIMRTLASQVSCEVHLKIEDKGPPPPGTPPPFRSLPAPDAQARLWHSVPELLRRIVSMYVNTEPKIEISEFAETTIVQVKVLASERHLIWGPETEFDYGRDGIIIGSIKNIFDGIGKGHGRQIRIVVSDL
jgi:predicted RNA-binding protein YlqC (UPF0109 family)